MNAKLLHERAQELVTRYLKKEAELIEILQKIDLSKAFRELGSPSLYAYATEKLGLPDGAAYNLITVARKAREVPALQTEIKNGTLTVSKARRIAAVVTLENQDHWIGLAKTLPKAVLEQEIARVAPQTLTPERAKYVTADRIKLEIGVSEELMKKLKRVQDLLSQAGSKSVTLEEALDAMTSLYLERRDPVEKAKRVVLKTELKNKRSLVQEKEAHGPQMELGPGRVIQAKKLTLISKRQPRPAALDHQIQIRDEGRCVQKDAQGNRCTQTRWTDVHHVVPVAQGGQDTLENLVTVCRDHHRMIHMSERNDVKAKSF